MKRRLPPTRILWQKLRELLSRGAKVASRRTDPKDLKRHSRRRRTIPFLELP